MSKDQSKNTKRQPKIDFPVTDWSKVEPFKPDFPGQSYEEQQHGINTQEKSDAKTEAYRNLPRRPSLGKGFE